MSTKAIEQFLQTAYSDERLSMPLAHCESGRLAHMSCCCIAGVPTATHALKGENHEGDEPEHWRAQFPKGGYDASMEFNWLAPDQSDVTRRAKLIPLILAEMNRREALKIPEAGRGDSVVTEAQAGVLTK